MAWKPKSETRNRPTPVLTLDELVVHLREASAECVYFSRGQAFRDGTIPLTATYAFSSDEPRNSSRSKQTRTMLTSVFGSIGDQIWFLNRKWRLD